MISEVTEFKKFNEDYTSDKAKTLREEISDLSFSLQYLSFRMNILDKKLKAKNEEYMKLLGVNDNGEVKTK